MASSHNLRRGLAVLSLFLIRGFHATGGGSCDVSATSTTSISRTLVVDGAERKLVAGKASTVKPSIVVTSEVPTTPYCQETDEEAEEDDGNYFGCGKSNTCQGTWISTSTDTSYESATKVTATCTTGCTVTVNADETIAIVAEQDAVLTVTAISPTSGETLTTTATLDVVPDVPRLATRLFDAAGNASEGPQVPANVFLMGQTFTWCLLAPAPDTLVEMGVHIDGELDMLPSTTTGCTTFRTTQKGVAHLTLSSGDKTVTADVTTVDAADVTSVEFVDLDSWEYGGTIEDDNGGYYGTTDEITPAQPLDTSPTYENDYGQVGSDCKVTALARFSAGGRTGLVPASAISTTNSLATATVGSATASVPLFADVQLLNAAVCVSLGFCAVSDMEVNAP